MNRQVIELLISPIAAGIFGLFGLVVGKRVDNHFKTIAERKADEKKAALEYQVKLDNRHNTLFESFIVEQKNAAVAFEGIHVSVTHIGEELAKMREETKEFRSEIFSRIQDLESTTSKHEGILEHMDHMRIAGR